MNYKILNDCCKQITDYVASGSFASLKANVKITNNPDYAIMVKTADFSNNFTKDLTYTDKHGYEFLHNSNLFGGELILSNIGSIGKVFIVPKLDMPMTLASNTIMVRPNDDFSTKYLYYFFLSPNGQNQLDKISSATSMRKFNKTQLKTTIIPAYSINKQQEIVSILDTIVNIINADKKQLELLDEAVKSRFIEMFGDPILNDKGWQIKDLNDITDVRDGTHDSPKYYDNGYPFVTSKNLVNGEIDFSSCQLICEEDYLHFNDRSCVDDGDILMPMIGTIGGAIIVKKDRDFAIKNVALIKFNKDNSIINRIFILNILNSDSMNDYFNNVKKGGTQNFISLGLIRKIPIIVPPIELQNQFESFVEKIGKSKISIQQHLDLMEELLDKKMEEFFGGE